MSSGSGLKVTSPTSRRPSHWPVRYDNYDLTRDLAHDEGIVEFDDFTYYLDFWLAVYANLEFGGILSPIPDLARFKLFDISFSDITGVGIPLPSTRAWIRWSSGHP